MSRSKIGWLEHLENGWILKFDFQEFLKNFARVRVCSLARVSCLMLVMLLSIYRGSLDGKSKQKRLVIDYANIFHLKQIKYLKKFDFLMNAMASTNLASILGYLGLQGTYKISPFGKIYNFHILYNLILN